MRKSIQSGLNIVVINADSSLVDDIATLDAMNEYTISAVSCARWITIEGMKRNTDLKVYADHELLLSEQVPSVAIIKGRGDNSVVIDTMGRGCDVLLYNACEYDLDELQRVADLFGCEPFVADVDRNRYALIEAYKIVRQTLNTPTHASLVRCDIEEEAVDAIRKAVDLVLWFSQNKPTSVYAISGGNSIAINMELGKMFCMIELSQDGYGYEFSIADANRGVLASMTDSEVMQFAGKVKESSFGVHEPPRIQTMLELFLNDGLPTLEEYKTVMSITDSIMESIRKGKRIQL